MKERALHFVWQCSFNRTIPILKEKNLERWNRIETAKHRIDYSLLKLNLPIKPKTSEDDHVGLAFDFLADVLKEERVLTGHGNGLITLNIEEADQVERVKNKLYLGEKYRTLLGHFRHESCHYYWDVLIKDHSSIDSFRTLFGNENPDYSQSLKHYYEQGPPLDWSTHFISQYAASHAWEDRAETWSHYLHLMDTLETAYYFGLHVNQGEQTSAKNVGRNMNDDPYAMESFQDLVESWLPLMFAVSSLSRSMGHMDLYSLVIADEVIHKLQFIHNLCRHNRLEKRD